MQVGGQCNFKVEFMFTLILNHFLNDTAPQNIWQQVNNLINYININNTMNKTLSRWTYIYLLYILVKNKYKNFNLLWDTRQYNKLNNPFENKFSYNF